MNNNTEKLKTKLSIDDEQLNDLIIDAIHDIKGKRVVKIDLRDLPDAPVDYFIICEGDSIVQARGITDNVLRRTKTELKVTPFHREATTTSRWLLLDYFQTVVHVFHPEAREFYDLESLWSDGKTTEYQDV